MHATSTPLFRPVTRIVRGMPASDGAGVRMLRVIGQPQLPNLDPFLMLDAFGSDRADDYIAGFPDHPHRGFETVTYMLAGRMRHRDSQGNSGDLGPGSVQWMTAGRGIVHSEMPLQESGRMAGFQLWVNLPARDKMCAPRYQDIPADRVPVVAGSGLVVKVLAGRYAAADGPVSTVATDPGYLDATLEAGARFDHAIAPGHTAFAYVFEGEVGFGDAATPVRATHLAVLGPGERVGAVGGPDGGRFILVSGRPLGEPIVQYGPFVMNTAAEIRQAIDDFQAGRF
ncbi:MAG: pirin family protein [Burkholderiales bacterium]|nr:pirin family protein [Burkholderiales bacterium]